jgi:hypothetical protein
MARKEAMPLNDYLKLLGDAGITYRSPQEKYSRYLHAAIEQEGIKIDDIVGVGESDRGFYVVTRLVVMDVHEYGMFKKKRIEVNQVAPIGSIAKLGTRNEIPSAAAVKFEGRGERCTLTGWDSKGKAVLEIVWDGSESAEIARQRDHLFKVIGDAMNNVPDAPARPPISSAESKAAYLREWAADVVRESGVEITPKRVEEHANMIAGGIRFEVFLKLGAPYGIDDLAKLYPRGEMPPGTIIATFDDLYGNVVALVGDARLIDQEIDLLLARCWGEFVNGCRDTYA